MSVFISAKYENCIHVLTDAAVYTPDGTLVGIKDKCWYSCQVPIAITGRGAAGPVEKLAELVIGFADRSSDLVNVIEFLESVPARLREWLPLMDENETHFEVVVAYYSESEGFVQRALWTHEFNSAPALEWHTMEGWIIGAPDVRREKEIERMATQINPASPHFLPTFGAQIVDLMREDITGGTVNLHPGTDWLSGAAVGGHVRLTTVTQDGVVSELLKTYNDAVGEPINPYREHGNIMPISRLKKRRLERKKSKQEKVASRMV